MAAIPMSQAMPAARLVIEQAQLLIDAFYADGEPDQALEWEYDAEFNASCCTGIPLELDERIAALRDALRPFTFSEIRP